MISSITLGLVAVVLPFVNCDTIPVPPAVLDPLAVNNLTTIAYSAFANSSIPYPKLELPYANYLGFHNISSQLNVFLGVRYAASTEGKNRWKEAQPPENELDKGWFTAWNWPEQCPQSKSGGVVTSSNYSPTQALDSEDCLFLSIWAPPDAKDLPVLLWIHGGGWDHNSAREFDLTPMLNAANNSFVGITVQYRLGALGFLASDQMRQSRGLNAGITDVRAALRWVKKHVRILGGDPSKVTIWGQSSGGSTVAHLVAAESTHHEKLFRGAIASSPWLAPMGNCSTGFWADQFHNFSSAANCTDDLECLRNVSSEAIRILNNKFDSIVPPGHIGPYQACIEGVDGNYLKNNTASLLASGSISAYVLAGNNYHDGVSFVSTSYNVPANAANATATGDGLIVKLLKADFPLTDEQITRVLELYPFSEFSTNQLRGAEIFQDLVFGCTSNWLATGRPTKSYRYIYAAGTAVHAVDNADEAPYFYNTLRPASPSFYKSFIQGFTSFIRCGNPNTYVDSVVAAEGHWPTYSASYEYKVFNLTEIFPSRVNVSSSYIGFDDIQSGTDERCQFWKNVRISGGW
ncbi:hypothetical protein HDU82_002056 [Entophlyctis luteolus]|nr:hypothetical protein HDU82_002056 [Entophlyctis luteolus]